MGSVGPVPSSSDELAHPDEVHPGLLLSVWVLHQLDLGIRAEAGDLGEFNEVIDALAVVLEVEAGVLEGVRRIDDGLAEILDLLLRRRLQELAQTGHLDGY